MNNNSSAYSRLSYYTESENSITIKVPSKFVEVSLQSCLADLENLISQEASKPIKIKILVKKDDEPVAVEVEEEKVEEEPVKAEITVKKSKNDSSLNSVYTFENFVSGENIFAYNACRSIAENPGGRYNPCLLYGGVGLGKTHLLQAIGNFIVANSKLKVRYTTTENFMNEFIESINNKNTSQFKNKFRKYDVLLVDDIQFLENKESTQTEMFNTFNDLYETGRQLVFTSDRPVSEIKTLTERLRSRFERGLNIDIQPPLFETRLAILREKCKEKNQVISDSVLTYVAENVQTNVRDLEACLTKLIAYSELISKDISLSVAQELLKNSIRIDVDKSTTSISTIINVVANYFKVSVFDIKGKNKNKSISNARQIAMYLCNTQTDFSYTEIGVEFGGKDHSTVMYGVNKIKNELQKSDNEMKTIINQILVELKAALKKK